ncbi:MAG: rhodanese-like domain-containing protein, partial [Planctomycetota bacterium]
VTDTAARADSPVGVVTGDFMFVGDLGRPDLLETAAGHVGSMESSAQDLYRTLRRISSLEDYVQVWPGHGAGSACGKALGAVPSSTVGYERRFNPAILAASDERTFIDFILSGQPEPPLYFADMKQVNRDGPSVLGELPAPDRLSAASLAALDTASFAVIDTRPWEAFRRAHVPGSMSFPLTPSFCTDAGSFVRASDRIVLMTPSHERDEAIRCLVRIGLDDIVSWFDSDELDGLGHAGRLLASIDEVDPATARERLDAGRARLLDVRRLTEFEAGHAPGAINASHTRLADRLDEIDPETDWLVVCRSGARSARSAAYLKRRGYRVSNVAGGMLGWESQQQSG